MKEVCIEKWISNEKFDKFTRMLKEKKIVIYGMGNTADLYQEGLKRIEKILPVWGYCDTNCMMRKKRYDSKRILLPEELKKIEDICVLVCVGNVDSYLSISSKLNLMGIENYCINEVIFSLFGNDVKKCLNLFSDSLSKDVFIDAIDSFSSMHWPTYNESSDEYFSIDCMKQRVDNEIFVDCGAFDGDTIKEYLINRKYNFGKLIAFEPDYGNYIRCKKYIDGIEKDGLVKNGKILLYPYALGENECTLKIAHYGTENIDGIGSRISNEGDYEVNIVSIDNFIQDKIDFIKSDIESYDYKMLLGAAHTIISYKPLLSICVYHNALDFFQIPLLLKQFVPDYKLILRHYGENFSDYILYAYI